MTIKTDARTDAFKLPHARPPEMTAVSFNGLAYYPTAEHLAAARGGYGLSRLYGLLPSQRKNPAIGHGLAHG
jgi:hypothetical protein